MVSVGEYRSQITSGCFGPRQNALRDLRLSTLCPHVAFISTVFTSVLACIRVYSFTMPTHPPTTSSTSLLPRSASGTCGSPKTWYSSCRRRRTVREHPVSANLARAPSSFVLRPSSFVLRPSSFVLRPSSFVLRPPSSIHTSARSIDHRSYPPPLSNV
ncbi:hypothetical protein C8F01DRAFT_41022 [Mycena amicta]|nr:hypothetical protein C8F01DRAFT_41022 [Mycena amicta]